METAQAMTRIECNVTCPYCNKFQNRFEQLRHHFDDGEQRARECNAEIECIECKQDFIVDLIEF